MTEQKESPLPILLVITGAVLLSVALGWSLLGEGSRERIVSSDNRTTAAQESTSVEAPGSVDAPADVPVTDIDVSLRKARLAAQADVLAYPRGQSALHYYGRIMAAEPDHAIAKAELDTVLGRIYQTATSYLSARQFTAAHELAVLVAEVRPDHPLVHDVQQTLDTITGDMVARAMKHAQDGEDEFAKAVLVAAEELPGRHADYFDAVRDSISEIKESRKVAETRKVEKSRLATEKATKEWVEKVRGAIDSGQLIAPAGESARDYLAERSTPSEQKEKLTKELVKSIIAATKVDIGLGQLPAAESLLIAADELDSDDAEIEELRASLDQAFIEAEEAKMISTSDLVRLNTVQPRYPARAANRSITGWVELLFTVTPSGETDDIEVSRSEPETVFDNAAIRAVEQWTFEPRVFRGQPINQRTAVRLVFNIE